MAAPYGGLEGGTPTVLVISTEFGDATELPRDLTLRIQRYGAGVPARCASPRRAGSTWRPEYNAVLREFGGAGDGATFIVRASMAQRTVGGLLCSRSGDRADLPVPPEGLGTLLQRGRPLEAIILDTDGEKWARFSKPGRSRRAGDLSLVDEKAVTVARTAL